MNLNSRAPTTLSTSGDFTWIITELLTKKKAVCGKMKPLACMRIEIYRD